MKQYIRQWAPVMMWAGLIFYLSSLPDLKSELPTQWDLVLRKFAHATEYAVLGLLLLRAFRSYQSDRVFIVDTFFVLVLCVLFAISDEIHQASVIGRHGSFIDICIDGAGVLMAMAMTLMVRQKRRMRLW